MKYFIPYKLSFLSFQTPFHRFRLSAQIVMKVLSSHCLPNKIILRDIQNNDANCIFSRRSEKKDCCTCNDFGLYGSFHTMSIGIVEYFSFPYLNRKRIDLFSVFVLHCIQYQGVVRAACRTFFIHRCRVILFVITSSKQAKTGQFVSYHVIVQSQTDL